MQIIRFTELLKTPWKNGGGVTRNIASAQINGATVWRLSMADVSQDGAFSYFSGLMRILTVIKGDGMTLKSDKGDLQADLWAPVRFDGAAKIFAALNADALTDLNLMFDPQYCEGAVATVRGPHRQLLKPNGQRRYAVHVLAGNADFNSDTQLQAGDTLLLASNSGQLNLGKDAAALLITIDLNPQMDASKLVIATR